MKKRTRISTAENRMNRMFMVTKVFLAITPIICYFYVSMKAMMNGMGFQDILETDPNLTIVFLIAMLNPYVAYLTHLLQKKLKENQHGYALINMVFLLIATMLTMNVFYFMMLAYVFYKAIRYYQVDVKKTMHSLNVKNAFYCGGGSFFVMMISSVCLFATIRLM